MQLSSILFAVVAAVGALAQTADPSINTPTGVQQCLPVQLTFSGTAPPFVITVVPPSQAGAAPLVTVGTASSNAITWVANLPLGDYTLVIRDSLGRTNPSATFTINPGTDASCLTGSTSVPASSPAASTPVTTPVNSTPPATSAPASTPAASSAAATSKPSSASVVSSASAASTSTSANAAPTLQPMGIAGLVGLAGVAALL